ncbi:MAG TPA: alpha-N-arabinofuranosidase, partial [Candidatus Limnocylindrales bacterium]|nr:alpha-N-arabinofuranosidase [Candidatus Limnocylindrales bacterium]
LDPAAPLAEVDDRLFGSFIEHMGRAVYGGIFEPGHPTADAKGWRHDVLDLVRELGVTVVRYPGGNFVSGYDWEDGVGPVDARPTRLDLAWRSVEPNLVGTDDFLDWTRLAGTRPMLAVNLGTRGVDAARNLVEYCNGPPGSRYADWRVANGHADPHGVALWCLGNEMDGPWQIGHKSAVEYGNLADAAGRAMREVDPSIELVVCGSSGSQMPTFGTWEETVLDLAWDVADYVSVHSYHDPAAYDSVDAYLACSLDLDRTIATVTAIADAVAARKHGQKRVHLSVDEWNVWRLKEHQARQDPDGPFRRAPALAEDEQDLADALAVGCLLITLLRHADRVRIACLAQLVNVIPAIRTIDGGPAWRQTTSCPFGDVARHGRGTVLRSAIDGPTYTVPGEGDVSAIELVAVHDATLGSLTVFAVNRAGRPLDLEASLRDLGGLAVVDHRVLSDPDLHAANTADRPRRVVPVRSDGARLIDGRLSATLPPRSWNVIRLSGRALEVTGS